MLVLSARANSHVDVGNPSSIVRHPKKVTSLVEVGTSGLLPSWEYLFDHLSKYVSEQESHAILNGIRDKIRFDAPPEYTLVNSFMDVDKSIPVKTTAPEASTDANRLPINDENLKLLFQRPCVEIAYRVHPHKKKVIN